MLTLFNVDLHVHTCLSPCGDLRMSPRNIVREAMKKGISVVAICDHNSARNVNAVTEAAKGSNVTILPGMEICSREEVHVLAIFGALEPVLSLQTAVYGFLEGVNDPDAFGMQIVANESDEVEGFESKLLIGAVDLSVDRIVHEIHDRGGIAIASHIDKEAYSVMSQLGFIPEALTFDALELTSYVSDRTARIRYSEYGNYTFIRNSDAHYLKDIGQNVSRYLLEEPSFLEITMALKNINSRMVYLS